MRRLATLLGVILFAAPALAADRDPFPNQPGALPAEEIEAATAAMTAMAGGEKPLPLLASGRRAPEHVMPSYALFASPLASLSDRVRMRRQIICNYFRPMSGWQCSQPHDYFRMTANGIEHSFNHQVPVGAGNRQAVLEAVEFMYSRCFREQFKAIGGTPFTPSPDADFVSGVLDDGKGFNVMTGRLSDKDFYRLEKTDKGQDGCGFRIAHVRVGGVVLPKSYEKVLLEEQRQAIEAFKKKEAERIAKLPRQEQPQAPLDARTVRQRTFDKLADLAVLLCVVAGLLAVLAPPIVALARGRRWATRVALALGGACVVLGVAYAISLKIASLPDTGYGFLLVIPAVVLAALSCLVWVIASAVQKKQG